eukprot:g16275.t1
MSSERHIQKHLSDVEQWLDGAWLLRRGRLCENGARPPTKMRRESSSSRHAPAGWTDLLLGHCLWQSYRS